MYGFRQKLLMPNAKCWYPCHCRARACVWLSAQCTRTVVRWWCVSVRICAASYTTRSAYEYDEEKIFHQNIVVYPFFFALDSIHVSRTRKCNVSMAPLYTCYNCSYCSLSLVLVFFGRPLDDPCIPMYLSAYSVGDRGREHRKCVCTREQQTVKRFSESKSTRKFVGEAKRI